MKQILSAALLVAGISISATTLQAQNYYGGAVLDHDIMTSSDFASLSQTQVFGTARSMAMGGAFSSLGGDISSVSINPAGLGMFSREVVSITPMLSISNSTTEGVPTWVGNSKTTFGFPNMGATFKLAESSSGSLIALNAAISYNRVADYNSKSSFSSQSSYDSAINNLVPSINDVFMYQLDGAGLYPSSGKLMDYDSNPYFWPAQSAYNTLLIDPRDGNDGWTTNSIGHNASILSSYEMSQRGRSDEYNFALGGNIGNYLYFGATLSLQEITQSTEYTYQEEYMYLAAGDNGYAYATAEDSSPLAYQAEYSVLWQKTKLDGSGVNLKLGLIARPTRSIRIGVAYHSPTYYTIARSYKTTTEAQFWDNSDDSKWSEYSASPEFIDDYEYSWKFRTPSKLLLGGSIQVGSVGLISVDYERQWYNWMRVSNSPGEYSPYDYQRQFEDTYQATNTLRLGVEVKPTPAVALRAGGGFSTSMLQDESLAYNTPTPTDSNYFTCGLGFQLSATTTLDLAYQYYHQNYSSYKLFYVENSSEVISGSNLFNSSLDRNYISATFTFRL